MKTRLKYGSSKYKYVSQDLKNGEVKWRIGLPNVTKKRYATERAAALAVDKYLISIGKKPLNILVSK